MVVAVGELGQRRGRHERGSGLGRGLGVVLVRREAGHGDGGAPVGHGPGFDELVEVAGGDLGLASDLVALELEVDAAAGEGLLDVEQDVADQQVVGEEHVLL